MSSVNYDHVRLAPDASYTHDVVPSHAVGVDSFATTEPLHGTMHDKVNDGDDKKEGDDEETHPVRQRITILLGVLYGVLGMLVCWPFVCTMAITYLTNKRHGVALFRPTRFAELSQTHQTCLRVGTQVVLWGFILIQLLWLVGGCVLISLFIFT